MKIGSVKHVFAAAMVALGTPVQAEPHDGAGHGKGFAVPLSSGKCETQSRPPGRQGMGGNCSSELGRRPAGTGFAQPWDVIPLQPRPMPQQPGSTGSYTIIAPGAQTGPVTNQGGRVCIGAVCP